MEYPLLENREIARDIFRVSLEIPRVAAPPVPGQFYSIRCGDAGEALLRRPFSMHRLGGMNDTRLLEILYRVVGKGTAWLSRRQAGSVLISSDPWATAL